jgi:CubicO group peptidase (beta-lactamase class C family)
MKCSNPSAGPTRRVLLGHAGAMAALSLAPAGAAVAAEWPRADSAAPGIAPDLSARLDRGVQSGELANLHAVFIARQGKLVLQRYFEGTDDRWGTPLGTVAFSASTRHDIRSVTKSIVGLLYGIALAEGRVPALDTPVVSAFPAYADLAQDVARRQILISHVLSMTMGLEWNEDLPYTDARNSEIAMERSADRYRYVLSRPIVAAPGASWRYSGGATALLGHLIAKGAGVPLLDYARNKLFGPLGIEDVEWTAGLNGEAAAASGLRMRPSDLARVGQLVLQQGQWNGQTLVPPNWLEASLTPRVPAFEGVQYGYQWYLARRNDASPVYMGFGLGGQRLVVIPALDVVYVIFMGNYYRADQLKPLFAVQKLIHAALS